MRKSTIPLAIVFSMLVLIFSSCSNTGTYSIEFYQKYNAEKNIVSEKVEALNSNVNYYALLKSNKSFGDGTVGLTIYSLNDKNESIVGGSSVKAKSGDKFVVCSVIMQSPGKYKISVYRGKSDNVLFTKNITVDK